MKTTKPLILAVSLCGWLATAAEPPSPTPEAGPAADSTTPPPATEPARLEEAKPASDPVRPLQVNSITEAPVPKVANGEKGLRLNFRGVPLDMVLNYLSDAAGFIIVLETEVKGNVDVWSNQPLTKEEAVDLLNTVLHKNGYAAVRNGRTLKIVSRDDAKTKDIPVRSGHDPEAIAKSDEMVTQIIPVRYASAVPLVQNLQTLLPTYATMSANESGNALVITATQTDVRRMAQIVQALDTSISSVSTVRVFPLNYADAKELATAVKELFQQPAGQQNSNDRRQQIMNSFFGGGGRGGPGGPGGPGGRGGGGGGGGGGANLAAARVLAVADERSNSLIVSAPDELLPTIEQLVREIDVSIADMTELRVFPLRNADPQEIAGILAELFPDDTRSGSNNQGDFRLRFGGGPFGGGNRNAQANNSSERNKKKSQVIAVADQRTSSIIVSAASEMMPQIGEMITQLDASPAKKQKVFIYSLDNADVTQVEQIVRDMFDRSNTSGSRNANQNSILQNRSQQNQQINGQGIGQGMGGGNNGIGQSFR